MSHTTHITIDNYHELRKRVSRALRSSDTTTRASHIKISNTIADIVGHYATVDCIWAVEEGRVKCVITNERAGTTFTIDETTVTDAIDADVIAHQIIDAVIGTVGPRDVDATIDYHRELLAVVDHICSDTSLMGLYAQLPAGVTATISTTTGGANPGTSLTMDQLTITARQGLLHYTTHGDLGSHSGVTDIAGAGAMIAAANLIAGEHATQRDRVAAMVDDISWRDVNAAHLVVWLRCAATLAQDYGCEFIAPWFRPGGRLDEVTVHLDGSIEIDNYGWFSAETMAVWGIGGLIRDVARHLI